MVSKIRQMRVLKNEEETAQRPELCGFGEQTNVIGKKVCSKKILQRIS